MAFESELELVLVFFGSGLVWVGLPTWMRVTYDGWEMGEGYEMNQ